MKFKVRPYEPGDAAELLRLFYETVHSVNLNHYTPAQADAWIGSPTDGLGMWEQRFSESKPVVAEKGGNIIGFGNLTKDKSEIWMLYVHKDFQSRGVATELLDALEKKLVRKGTATALVESSITARPFFEKRGYRLVKEEKRMFNGQEFLNFTMKKELGADEDQETGNSQKELKNEKASKKKSSWRELWASKFIDLLIVITGVSIAFQLNNWKIESDQRSLERFYLESMTSDLRKDMEELQENLEDIKRDHSLVTSFRKGSGLSGDSLGVVLINVLDFQKFNSNENTYSTLINSSLTAISNRDIRGQVTEYYSRYAGINRFETVYTELLFRTFAYFGPYCDFAVQRVTDTSVLSRMETKNFLLVIESQLTDGMENYEDAIKNGNTLLQQIENNLKN